jgi:hypothetical protein
MAVHSGVWDLAPMAVERRALVPVCLVTITATENGRLERSARVISADRLDLP